MGKWRDQTGRGDMGGESIKREGNHQRGVFSAARSSLGGWTKMSCPNLRGKGGVCMTHKDWFRDLKKKNWSLTRGGEERGDVCQPFPPSLDR